MKNCSKYEDNLNIIGPILREKRKQLGINIPVTSLHRIENNQRTVRDYEICALSVALSIDISDLLGPMTDKFKIS